MTMTDFLEEDVPPIDSGPTKRPNEHDLDPARILDAGKDDAPISPRQWLLGNTFCRGFVSGLLAQGASAKTTIRIAQALAVATGRELTNEHVFVRSRTLIITLEDSLDELRRRIRAARLHHGVAAEELRGWLYLWAPAGLKLAEQRDGSRTVAPGELDRRIRAFVSEHKIDLVTIDPFVKAHTAEENDNSAIDQVAIILAALASDLKIATDTTHHAPKGPTDPGDANRARGASAFRDAARLLYTVTGMSETEREQFGLSEAERRSLVRIDSAKVNIVPPSIEARWFRIVGVPLANGTELYPHGDTVPAAEPWQPPDMWRDLSTSIANAILDQIERGPGEGQHYTDANRADDRRSAWRVVTRHCETLSEKQARCVISTWLANGMIERREYQDQTQRKTRNGLFVIKRPG